MNDKKIGKDEEIRVNRINQFEAEEFDDYMINIIVDCFKGSLDNLEYSEKLKKYMDELKLAIKMIYFSYKLMNDKFTEGQQVYNVKFNLKDNLTTRGKLKIISYLMCKIVLPYLMNKITDAISNVSEINDPTNNAWSRNYFKKVFLKFFIFMFKIFDLLLKISEFGNFLIFLITGKFQSIWSRLFKLEYVYINPNQDSTLSFNFLMKKIIWNQLAKIILYFFNVGVGKSNIQSLFDQLVIMVSGSDENQSSHRREICPICHKPPTNAYKSTNTNCAHIFCFFCITKHKQESGLCPVCYKELNLMESHVLKQTNSV